MSESENITYLQHVLFSSFRTSAAFYKFKISHCTIASSLLCSSEPWYGLVCLQSFLLMDFASWNHSVMFYCWPCNMHLYSCWVAFCRKLPRLKHWKLSAKTFLALFWQIILRHTLRRVCLWVFQDSYLCQFRNTLCSGSILHVISFDWISWHFTYI